MLRMLGLAAALMTVAVLSGCRSTTARRSGVTSIEPVSHAAPAGTPSEIIQTSAFQSKEAETGGSCRH